jgi:hypothetical protein
MMARAMLRAIVRACLVTAAISCQALCICWAQDAKSGINKAPEQKIIVRVLDGVTGLPMWFEFPNIWIGSASGVNPRLNIKGEVQVDVGGAKPREVRLLSNWYADCRYKGDVSTGREVKYSIDEILERGIVAENVCGLPHEKPSPGVVVLYVRHRTWKEIIAL